MNLKMSLTHVILKIVLSGNMKEIHNTKFLDYSCPNAKAIVVSQFFFAESCSSLNLKQTASYSKKILFIKADINNFKLHFQRNNFDQIMIIES